MEQSKNRIKTRIAVYLIVVRDDKILLGRRQNTGHMDGCWSLLAGHAYESESCLAAAMREAYEECGLELVAADLCLIGAMHHRSGDFDYMNYIFKVDLGQREIINLEPDKCEVWDFFFVSQLPEPMHDYVKFIIQNSFTKNIPWIAEYGW